MVLEDKTNNAEPSPNHVTKMVKSNLTNNNAMLAKHAVTLVKSLSETDVSLEPPVNASKNTMPPLTPVETAQPVNLLPVFVKETTIMDNANHSALVATKTEEDNCHNNNAINALTAQPDKFLELTTFVSSQDQHADATRLLTKTTNAKHAQPDNWLTPETQDVLPSQTPVTLETKLEEINSAAMHALPVVNSKFQTLQELLVLPDHSLTADV
jgi:hypothetical protein